VTFHFVRAYFAMVKQAPLPLAVCADLTSLESNFHPKSLSARRTSLYPPSPLYPFSLVHAWPFLFLFQARWRAHSRDLSCDLEHSREQIEFSQSAICLGRYPSIAAAAAAAVVARARR